MVSDTSKLNADISRELKIRLAVFAKRNEMYIRKVVEKAIESFLDKNEGKSYLK